MLKVYIFFVLFVEILANFEPENHTNWNLLPHDVCGRVASNRIVGGKVAAMNSYPWVARIGLTSLATNLVYFSCSAALINSDTLLSAAHCAVNMPEVFKLGPIRLGEYNVDTNPDCENGVCADPIIDIDIKEVLAPQGFSSSLFGKDLSLIRLAKKVVFSESISPICLGGKIFNNKDFVGKWAEVSGWGVNDINSRSKSKKLEVVRLPVLSHEVCHGLYIHKLEITQNHMCAGGEIGKDSCNGDSGGPLMIVDDEGKGPRYYLLGVVSFGPLSCGHPKMPGIYTKLSSYTEWVLNNLLNKNADADRVLL